MVTILLAEDEAALRILTKANPGLSYFDASSIFKEDCVEASGISLYRGFFDQMGIATC